MKCLEFEYHMTIGSKIQQVYGNQYLKRLYQFYTENLGAEITEPVAYGQYYTIDTPNYYYEDNRYAFLDVNGQPVPEFDFYTLINKREGSAGMPSELLHNTKTNKWCQFDHSGREAFGQLVSNMATRGLVVLISDNIV